MTTRIPIAVSPLRQRLIDEMDIRRFGPETHRNYIRDVGRFATFATRVLRNVTSPFDRLATATREARTSSG